MPYAKNGDINIYYEVEGEGQPIVLMHGASFDLSMFKTAGYSDALNNDYKLILVDARGHGKSDKPHDPSEYGPEVALKMTQDVITILDDLRTEKANYFGYSLGAQVGYRAAITHANRFSSFIFCGMTPYAYPEPWVQNTKFMIETMEESLKGFDVMIEYLKKTGGQPLSEEQKAWWGKRLQNMDVEAMVQVFTSEMGLTPLTNNDLEKITSPVLVYCGSDDSFHDGAEEAAKHMPNSEFISLADHDHMSSFNDINAILPHIKDFLSRVNK